VLARRDRVLACETLVLRARADLDAGRLREAALQLEAAARAMRSELDPGAAAEQREDLAAVGGRLAELVAIRDEAIAGEPSAGSAEALEEILETCERILRRRRILGDPG
jgi:hypothetical protein